ncbi:MAG TPA: methylenetetrahydrofolate reductase [Acidimicrobiia bacterium]|jgi:methylenetetrahydrofolate reductase (NADPH)
MAKIAGILDQGPSYSFEFGPPRTPEATAQFWDTLDDLRGLSPSFVSVTYGAGGSTRDTTRDIVLRINHEIGLTAMAHLTCAAHTRLSLEELLVRYREDGVENILALGGDPPVGYDGPPGELTYATDLVDLVRSVGDFSVGVAAHPEPHPRSVSIEADRVHTAAKLAEADFAITQFFFEARHYFDLVESVGKLGVHKPIVPGIMPATSVSSIERMSKLQGSEFPEWLAAKLRAAEPDGAAAVRAVGVEEATKLCEELRAGGVPGFHFFTLNRSTATREIYANLGL